MNKKTGIPAAFVSSVYSQDNVELLYGVDDGLLLVSIDMRMNLHPSIVNA